MDSREASLRVMSRSLPALSAFLALFVGQGAVGRAEGSDGVRLEAPRERGDLDSPHRPGDLAVTSSSFSSCLPTASAPMHPPPSRHAAAATRPVSEEASILISVLLLEKYQAFRDSLRTP